MNKIATINKKNDIKYVYFDLDGTLLDSDKNIPKKHIEAIKILKSKGIKVGIATWRPPYLALDIIDKIKPNLPTVTINGNLIYYGKDKQVPIKSLSQNQIKDFMFFAKKNKLNYLAYSDDAIYFKEYISSNHLDWIKKDSAKKEKQFCTPLFPLEKLPKNIYKFLITVKDYNGYNIDKIKAFVNKLKGTYLIQSQLGLLDLMPENVSKANALKYLEEKKILNLKNTMCIGDSNNDISMLKIAGLSVAMVNSTSDIKKHADIITSETNDQGGLLELINGIFQ